MNYKTNINFINRLRDNIDELDLQIQESCSFYDHEVFSSPFDEEDEDIWINQYSTVVSAEEDTDYYLKQNLKDLRRNVQFLRSTLNLLSQEVHQEKDRIDKVKYETLCLRLIEGYQHTKNNLRYVMHSYGTT